MKEWKDTNPSSPFTVTYYFTYGNIGKRLSELHTHHSNLTCFSEGTRVTGKVLQCLTRHPLFSERGQGWVQDWFIVLKKDKVAAGFPGCSDGKESGEMWETWVWSLGWERSPGREHGNPLQYFCLEKPHGQRLLVGYSPWGCKELAMTERLSTVQHSKLLHEYI